MSSRATTTGRWSFGRQEPAGRQSRSPVDERITSRLLRFDDDHAVGSAAAVHRGAGGVLQDFNPGDVQRIDAGQRTAGAWSDRDAVEDVQRLAASEEARRATDLD